MKIPVVWFSLNPETPPRGYWDQGILEEMFSNELWNPVNGYEFEHYEELTDQDGAVIIFPARSQVDKVKELNNVLKPLKWVVLFLTGDEEALFPLEKIKHPNIRIYVMSPRENLEGSSYRFLGTGYPTHMKKYISKEPPIKSIDYFFAGQITHKRREDMAEKITYMQTRKNMPGVFLPTDGFTKGDPPEAYYRQFQSTKIAPAPSGPETPDSFRLFEALELACVPIADTRVVKETFSDNYWTFFFGEEPPFPIIKNYDQFPGYVQDSLKSFPRNANRIYSWWIKKKREFAYQITKDIKDVIGVEPNDPPETFRDAITVIIPTSPIKSHPDVSILDETIKSVRAHLPDCEIILTFDGVREEQINRTKDYEEFIRRILWKCNFEYKNVAPLIIDEHVHQTGAARKAIEYVKTPLLLYVEQDTPLIAKDIDWKACMDTIIYGYADLIRFHHEAIIPKEHNHMIHGSITRRSANFMRTSQWSQRPHLASVAFYRRILKTCFSEDAKSFIEDKMHGVCSEAYLTDGIMGWENYRILIYLPEEKDIKRSYHTDGRAGAAKYDATQVF